MKKKLSKEYKELVKYADQMTEAQEEADKQTRKEMLKFRKGCKHGTVAMLRVEHATKLAEAMKGVKFTVRVCCQKCGKQLHKKTYICKHRNGFNTKNVMLGRKENEPYTLKICRDCEWIYAEKGRKKNAQ